MSKHSIYDEYEYSIGNHFFREIILRTLFYRMLVQTSVTLLINTSLCLNDSVQIRLHIFSATSALVDYCTKKISKLILPFYIRKHRVLKNIPINPDYDIQAFRVNEISYTVFYRERVLFSINLLPSTSEYKQKRAGHLYFFYRLKAFMQVFCIALRQLVCFE